MSSCTIYDVVVIGAGQAGTRAALELAEKGHCVCVIEARNRAGGRTFTQPVAGCHLDVGGQWVSSKHPHAMEMIKRFNLELIPQYDTGKHVLELCGERSIYQGNISECTQFGRPPELDDVNERLDRMSQEVPVEAPADAPKAAEWDRMSLSTWVHENVRDRGAQEFIKWFSRVCLAAEPNEASLLFYLWWLRSGGGYENLVNIRGGAQEYWLTEGTQPIAERMLEAALHTRPKCGGSNTAMFEAPVRTITQNDEFVDVMVADGRVVRARYCINTIAPALTTRVYYNPPLPAMRDQLAQRMPMGCVIKFLIVYNRPFWRDFGFSGELVSDVGPCAIAYDKCIMNRGLYALVALAAGAGARVLGELCPEERRARVLAQFERVFECDEAKHPIEFCEHNWMNEEWSRGCYFGVANTSGLLECSRGLAQPHGRIHWAGTETARTWIGYIEGAMESGLRAATEVSALICRTSPTARL